MSDPVTTSESVVTDPVTTTDVSTETGSVGTTAVYDYPDVVVSAAGYSSSDAVSSYLSILLAVWAL